MRHRLLFLGAALGGCAPIVPPVARHPAPTAVTVEPSPAPTSSSDPLATAAGVTAFLTRICDAARAGDHATVERLVELPLRGQEPVGDMVGARMLGGIFHDDAPESVARRSFCALGLQGQTVGAVEVERTRIRAYLEVLGHRFRFTIDREPNRLVEQTIVVNGPAVPEPAPLPAYDITTDVMPRGDVTPETERLADATSGLLADDPACLARHAARETTSAAMWVRVEILPEGPEVDVYASTAAPASLVGCVTGQLRPSLSEVASSFEEGRVHELWINLGVLVPADQLPDDVPTIEMITD